MNENLISLCVFTTKCKFNDCQAFSLGVHWLHYHSYCPNMFLSKLVYENLKNAWMTICAFLRCCSCQWVEAIERNGSKIHTILCGCMIIYYEIWDLSTKILSIEYTNLKIVSRGRNIVSLSKAHTVKNITWNPPGGGAHPKIVMRKSNSVSNFTYSLCQHLSLPLSQRIEFIFADMPSHFQVKIIHFLFGTISRD